MNDLVAPISRLTNVLPYLLDPKVGIIGRVNEHSIEADSPDFFRFIGSAANTEAFGEYINFAIGGGASITRELALAKTIGEAIERYCSAIYDKEAFPLVSYEKANFPCIHPGDFALYSQDQYDHPEFMFDPFLESSPVRWVEALDLYTNELVYVPASMVYVPYFFYENGDETPIIQPISTGLACHCSFEEAAIGGICEVIERDCFMITWQAKLSRPQICLTTLSESNKDLVRRFEEVGYKIYLMDMSNESRIPGILTVARHMNSGFPSIVVAAAVALSAEEAVKKSLEELAHTERYAYQIKHELPRLDIDPEFDNIVGQVQHINYWLNSDVLRHAEFLFQSNNFKSFEDLEDFETHSPKRNLEHLISTIHKTGYRVLVRNVTTPDVNQLGLHVIKAIIPGYHPLFMGYHKRPLGGERLWTIPQKLGFKGITKEGGDYPFPHPFP